MFSFGFGGEPGGNRLEWQCARCKEKQSPGMTSQWTGSFITVQRVWPQVQTVLPSESYFLLANHTFCKIIHALLCGWGLHLSQGVITAWYYSNKFTKLFLAGVNIYLMYLQKLQEKKKQQLIALLICGASSCNRPDLIDCFYIHLLGSGGNKPIAFMLLSLGPPSQWHVFNYIPISVGSNIQAHKVYNE